MNIFNLFCNKHYKCITNNNNTNIIKIKKIRFNNVVKVRIIFNICDYIQKEELWWSKIELNNIKFNNNKLNIIIDQDNVLLEHHYLNQ